MVVTLFFTQNKEFHDKNKCERFAGAMLHRNHFLFNHNDGDEYMVCCIMLSLSNLMFCRNGQGFGETNSFYRHSPRTLTLWLAVCRSHRWIAKILQRKQRLRFLSLP